MIGATAMEGHQGQISVIPYASHDDELRRRSREFSLRSWRGGQTEVRVDEAYIITYITYGTYTAHREERMNYIRSIGAKDRLYNIILS
jgi:hypothetical protein